MIEESILEADKTGVEVLSLGLLNQGEVLNENGELYVQRNPDLKVKVVDGSSLAAVVVLNTIPEGTTKVLLNGRLSKVAYAIIHVLCQRGIQVATVTMKDYEKLKTRLIINNNTEHEHEHLVFSSSYAQKIWLVGDGLSKAEQLKAPKGTVFIPYSQFPPKKVRKDCFYHSTPAMIVPKSLENMDSCENWLARRVMSAWRVAGIVHALEGWGVNECGQAMLKVEEMWEATLQHGFLPLQIIPP
ncbi:very-long-chain aldehyde decarbonylase CER1-like [Tripterygium wilfordii]|uniref:very-long-chain aldehyde decarbonylase CER1-like n=1 Tax=Tripterygium wilfordii TaxID=458696 RepID=UPI0018F7FF33|nr:very-long-chain aldehyde decarbonylase CER1-like [Tripterygium wilfordii]